MRARDPRRREFDIDRVRPARPGAQAATAVAQPDLPSRARDGAHEGERRILHVSRWPQRIRPLILTTRLLLTSAPG